MRSAPLSLGFLLLFGGACSQLIGLGDYENTDATAGSGGASGGVSAKGGGGGAGGQGGRGGTGGRTTTGGSGGGSGGESGGGGVIGSSGSGPEGGVGAQAGTVGEAGSDVGGAGGAGGSTSTGGDATAGNATGGAGTGGTTGGSGGKGGTGGTTGGAGGKGGTGGATGGTGGKGGTGGTTGGTGGTTGGTGGKGGSGGTTGGTGGKGGTGGSCSTQDLLLNNNPNFDDSNAAPPEPAPWKSSTTSDVVIVNRQAYLSNAGVTAHTGGNAAWLGGVGSNYKFDDGSFGEIYILDLDVTIPLGATQVTLSCYYQSQTLETSATIDDARDILVAWLWDNAASASAYVFQRLYPANTTSGWHLFTNTASGGAAAALAGRTLTLEFYAEVDGVRRSDFFVDTCSLKVTVCN